MTDHSTRLFPLKSGYTLSVKTSQQMDLCTFFPGGDLKRDPTLCSRTWKHAKCDHCYINYSTPLPAIFSHELLFVYNTKLLIAFCGFKLRHHTSVSYTHLDVYKRQVYTTEMNVEHSLRIPHIDTEIACLI